MNDRRLKQKVLEYSVGKLWFPQLELLLQSPRSTATKAYEITDIDVYVAIPDEFNGYRSILFDCKSGRRESPVTRALWLRGLMDHFGAGWGLCLFNEEKGINMDHRETSAELGISLMTISEFDIFAKATSEQTIQGASHISDIDKWDAYTKIAEKNKSFQKINSFATSSFWALKSPGDQCRHIIALLRSNKGEFDPSKREHLVIFGNILSLFLFGLAQVGNRLFKSYLQPNSRDELDKVLLPYIYGGRETYNLINKLSEIIPRKSNSTPSDVTLPEWNMFAQLIRSTLDAPMQALYSPLLAKEISWSFLEEKPDLSFAKNISLSKRQVAKFCLQATKYLIASTKLPPEFGEIYQEIFLDIQSTSSSQSEEFQPRLIS